MKNADPLYLESVGLESYVKLNPAYTSKTNCIYKYGTSKTWVDLATLIAQVSPG